MKNFFKQLLFVVSLTLVLSLPFLALAQISNESVGSKLEQVGIGAGYSPADEYSVSRTIGIIISTLLSFLGVIFIILVVISGYQWMTAGGNEEQVKKAQSRMKNAIIGLVVVVSCYAAWRLIDEFFIMRI
ncbi:MAG: hypothetical protein WC280_02905 [Patescibacteria group bacterium]